MGKLQIEEQLPYAYWLHALWLLNGRKLWKLTEKIGEPEEIYRCERERLGEILNEKQLALLEKSRETWDIHREWEKLKEKNIKFLPFFHPDYPDKLKNIPDPPWALYLKGRMPEQSLPAVSVVGARQCSEYGRFAAGAIGKCLGENGLITVSGMARGIDGISQSAAIEAGGSSLAVLGCGVDICYPKENRKLYERLEEKGGIVSEYPPGTQPLASLFPPRNRIISGFGDVLVVVEAKEKSGTLITVDMALEQGKEVLVLPGRITDELSRGCNCLVKQGAGLLTAPADILQLFGIRRETKENNGQAEETGSLFHTKEEKRIYEILDFLPKSTEEIWKEYGKEQITIQQLMNELLRLCLRGLVAQTGGSYYKKAEGLIT